MRGKVLACFLAVACLAQSVLAQAPDFSRTPSYTLNLPGQQTLQWKLLNESLLRQRPVVALEIVKTNLKNPFPGADKKNERGVYSNPPAPVTFRVAFDNFPSAPSRIALQFSSSPASFNGAAPYAGWEKPSGLLMWHEILNINPVTNPNPGGDSINLPVRPQDVAGSETVSASQRIATFEYTLPFAQVASPGKFFYARVVPIATENGKTVAIGPSSNWVYFYVAATAQDKAIAEAQAKAAAENKILVTKASEAQKAIRDNYEVRLLSYIPPKFKDDPGAADYFVAHSQVSITYDKTKVTNIGRGETYSVNYMRNLLASNKTWSQELWDVTSAALNQQNSFFQAAKAGLVDGIAKAIETASGVKVGNDVRAGILKGLDLALVYCGIPPSLPNIDQLYSRGVDYLAATIADYALEQATGVAIDEFGADPLMTMAVRDAVREQAKQETAKLIEKLTKPAPFDLQTPETWGTPAPFFRRRPAMVYLEIRLRPGRKPVTGVTWQALELRFPGSSAVFENIPSVALPRAVGDRLVVPVALASSIPPQNWVVNGYMPHPHVAPGVEAGQPYYKAMSDINVMVITHHRMTGSGATFGAFMDSFKIKPHLVNARAIPEGRVQKPGAVQKALDENPVTLGPQNYYGRVQYWPFSVP